MLESLIIILMAPVIFAIVYWLEKINKKLMKPIWRKRAIIGGIIGGILGLLLSLK